jgi:hypothetical protein
MTTCPICQFENEDGALFCEKCKSDLAAVEPSAEPAESWVAAASPDNLMAAVLEAAPPAAEVAIATATPLDENAIAAGGLAMAEAVPLQSDIQVASPVEPAPRPVAADVHLADTQDFDIKASQPIESPALPAQAKPKLLVLRGQKINAEYPLYEGENYIGRADEEAVDIDLEEQESAERIWSSRQHALIVLNGGQMSIEDLNSTNGTFVNRLRVHPGQKRPLQINDVIQIGTVQMKVTV